MEIPQSTLSVVMIAFRVYSERIHDAETAISEFVEAVGEREPGTLWYQSFQDSQDPTRFVHYMGFEDESAHEHHRETAHVNRFVETLYPLCAEQPQAQNLTLLTEARRP